MAILNQNMTKKLIIIIGALTFINLFQELLMNQKINMHSIINKIKETIFMMTFKMKKIMLLIRMNKLKKNNKIIKMKKQTLFKKQNKKI